MSLQSASAQINRTWIGTINLDWYNPTNWTPNGVPATNDIVNFTNLDGTINLSAPVVIANQFNWQGGTLVSNAITIESNAVLNINGTSTLYLNCALTNAGTVNWNNNLCTLDVENGFGSYFGLIVNLPGALFNIENDASMYDTIAANSAYFLNEGTLQKSAGTGTTYIYISILNSGSVTAQQGTLYFYGAGLLAGTFTADAGTAIYFGNGGNGNFTNSVPVSINGPGAVQLTGGTLTLLTDVIPNLGLTGGTVDLGPAFQGGAITNLTIDGATLAGTNTVTGTFNWNNGTIFGGPLTIAANGVLNINGNTTLYLQSPLTNVGTVNYAGTGGLDIQYGGSDSGLVVNVTGALWNIENNESIYDNASPGAYFQNAGTLEKSAGLGTTYIYIPLVNSGSVIALQGILDLYGGGPVAGAFTANAGAAIDFASGGFTNSLPVSINGSGAVQLTGGTLTLLTDTIANLPLTGGTVELGPAFQGGTITNLTIDGATLAGTNTVTGTFNWENGTISGGPLTIATNGVLNINGNTTLFLENPLTNAGTVNYAGTGSLDVQYGGSTSGLVVNVTGALWNIENNQSIFDNASPGAYFQNAGTLEKSAGTGTTYIYLPTTNSGAITALKGNLAFYGAFTPVGGEMLFGLSGANNFGTMYISGNATLGGTVGVIYENGFVPTSGNSWTVLTYGSYSGIFTNTSFPAGPIWVTNYGPDSFTISVSNLDKLAFTTQPVGNALTNVTLAPVVVQVEDPSNNLVAVSGIPITLALDGSGTLHGTLTQNTDGAGKATFADLSISTAGTKTVRATTPQLTSATSVPFQILPLVGLQFSHSGFLISLNGNNDLNPLSIFESTNLFTWVLIYTNGPTNGQIQYLDTAATNSPARFYHLVVP